MSEGQKIIEWLIDALPPGLEWAGRPIVGLSFLCAAVAVAFVAWAAWKVLASLVREWKE
jgi:hypothetical protein